MESKMLVIVFENALIVNVGFPTIVLGRVNFHSGFILFESCPP
jgi:hypothetical protein